MQSKTAVQGIVRALPKEPSPSWITPRDLTRSMTAHMLVDLRRALAPLQGRELRRMLDIGCGFGGVACFTADLLGIRERHGVDRDEDALWEARQKGLETAHMEIGRDPLPYPDSRFDLITCFGMLDYLPDFDPAINEVLRVVRPGGYVLISLPNLASWHNRLALLLGYQPRDVEISQGFLAGVHPHYRRRKESPVGHIHTATTAAFRELMEAHGFETVRMTGSQPVLQRCNPLLFWLDRLFSVRAELARRFFYLGRVPG